MNYTVMVNEFRGTVRVSEEAFRELGAEEARALGDALEEAGLELMRRHRLATVILERQFNNGALWRCCAICETSYDASLGTAYFVEGTRAIVCDECGDEQSGGRIDLDRFASLIADHECDGDSAIVFTSTGEFLEHKRVNYTLEEVAEINRFLRLYWERY